MLLSRNGRDRIPFASRFTPQRCHRVARLASPFLLRTADPPLESAEGQTVTGFRRLGKRIAIGLGPDLWLVLHLMIAGRLHWREKGAKLPGGRNCLRTGKAFFAAG